MSTLITKFKDCLEFKSGIGDVLGALFEKVKRFVGKGENAGFSRLL